MSREAHDLHLTDLLSPLRGGRSKATSSRARCWTGVSSVPLVCGFGSPSEAIWGERTASKGGVPLVECRLWGRAAIVPAYGRERPVSAIRHREL